MNFKTDSPADVSSTDVSLVCGGRSCRFQQALGLVRPGHWNLGRRIAVLIVIGWVPLFLITALLNPDGLVSLMREYRLYARMLIAVPVLLGGEVLMEARFRAVIAHIQRAGLLEASTQAHLEGVIARLVRARDSVLPEFAVLRSIDRAHCEFLQRFSGHDSVALTFVRAELYLTAAGWYAVIVSTSIFQFLLGVGIWKWLLWTFFAFKLSRCDLKLLPTHPDRHGGLGFLGLTSAAFAPIAFSATAVIAATWRQDILYHGAHLMNFKWPAIVLVALIALVALGPLAFSVPRLAGLRRQGILEYGILGQLHSA